MLMRVLLPWLVLVEMFQRTSWTEDRHCWCTPAENSSPS
jgi:hypothetical protein